MTQYALVPKAEPVVVVTCDDEPPQTTTTTTTTTTVTSQLLHLYEAYAEIYPNPAIHDENQERDRLLRAISAANHAVQVNPKKETKKSSWWNLFGGGGGTEKKDRTTRVTIYDENDDVDDRLIYSDTITTGGNGDDPESDRDSLLGTGYSLDRTCIPEEVHSLARYHLCRHRKSAAIDNNNQTSLSSSPNIARTFWETAGTSCLVITGLGQFVEFRKRNTNMDETTTTTTADHTYTSAGRIVYTSDRMQLLDYESMRRRQQQKQCGKKTSMSQKWHPSNAEAAMIGPNFLMVHWGWNGVVTFYRRVAVPPVVLAAADCVVTWEAVAQCGVTALVRASLTDLFAEPDGETEQQLRQITAVHALVVELPPQQAPVATLAVARLGGFIELIPLPPQMWYGAELPFAKKKHILPQIASRGTKRRKGDGLVMNLNLPDLAMSAIGGDGIVVLNVTDYHSDVYGLESLALAGIVNESWDPELYPDGPPAQFVLAAHGTNLPSGRPTMSFWSYSTTLSPTAPGGVGFSIHATIVEAMDLGKTGPDVTLFASPTIYRYWRKPRHIQLRDSTVKQAKNHRITTLSLSVPIVQISFVLLGGNQNNTGDETTVWAAVLDWNGGVTMLDCSMLIRAAAQTLRKDEYTMMFGNDTQNEVKSLANVIADRSKITRSILKTVRSRSTSICVSYVKCFQKPSSDDTCNVMIAALTGDCIYFISSSRNTTTDSLTFETTMLPCPTVGIGQFLISSKRQFILNVIFQATRCASMRPTDSTITINFCAVQKLKPYDIIASMMRSMKFKEAIIAAENLPSLEKDKIAAILEDCKKALWEAEFDVSVLDSIENDEYIVAIARRPPSIKEDEQSFLRDDVHLYRAVCLLALKRIKSARTWKSLAFADDAIVIKSRLVKLGTYDLLCEYQLVQPSLRHFLNDFMKISIIDFATSCAIKTDISTLSVLWFRHRDELFPDHLGLLNAIPVSISPILYQHILPVVTVGNMDDNSDVMFMFGSGINDICSFSKIPDYMNHHFQRKIVVDQTDDFCVREKYYGTDLPSIERYDAETLSDWYHRRALEIQRFTASLSCVTTFAQLGLNALQIQNSNTVEGNTNLPPSAMSLRQFVQFSELLNTIPVDSKYLASLGLKAFDSISTSDIVALTFYGADESKEYQTRYNNYLLPLVMSKLTGLEEQEVYTVIDDSIEAFCTSILDGYQKRDISDFLDAVRICSVIVHLSRASLSCCSRIIKRITTVVRLVAKILEKVVRIGGLLQLNQNDEQLVLEKLWEMYESLPVSLPLSCDSNDDLTTIMDFVGKNLTFLDIVARWPDTSAFVTVLNYHQAHDTNDFLLEGEKAGVVLCRSFCNQVKNIRGDAVRSQKAPFLISALVNDCNELNIKCFKGQVRMNDVLTRCIVKPLVSQNDANLVVEYLSKAGLSLMESKAILSEVFYSFNEAVGGGIVRKSRETKLKAANEFQSALAKYFPAILDEIQPLQRCISAVNFIVSTLMPDTSEILCLEKIQSMRGLDVIEWILRHNPKAIVLNCSDWENPAWAKQANEMIRHQSSLNSDTRGNSFVSPSVTNFPGDPIFHLAQLLDLSDLPSVIAVKSRVIDVALTLNFDGAAAMVCRSLMTDSASTKVGIDLALDAVAKISSREQFDDASTKQELCISAQHLFSSSIQAKSLDSCETISTSWSRLQHQNVLWHHGRFYSMLSFGLFYSEAMPRNGVDVVDRVSVLNIQLTKCLIHDPTLMALAREALIWCIDQTTKASAKPLPSLHSVATGIIASFAALLLFHVHDRKISLDCLKDVKNRFDEQVGNKSVLETSAAAGTQAAVSPNPEIVKNLIGRGYSENGARRSALAVNNRSFHEALQWAVGHSLEVGFDDPCIFVLSANELKTDVEKAEFLRNVLDTLIMSLEHIGLDIDTKMEENIESKEVLRKGRSEDEPKSKSIDSSFASKVSIEAEEDIDETVKTAQSAVSFDGDKSNATNFPIATAATARLTFNGTDLFASSSNVKSSPGSAPVVSLPGNRSNLVVAVPKSNEASPDRSTLYQVGQVAFVNAQQQRLPSSNPTRAERLRLIEEGRRLLKQARSGLSPGFEQNGYFPRSASSTPSSMFYNKEADIPAAPPASIETSAKPLNIPEPKKMSEKPPQSVNDESNGADEWDFDDENFDL